MSEELSLPLHEMIVDLFAASDAEGPSALMEKRLREASNEKVVLADVSSSMASAVGDTCVSKYVHMRYALLDVAKSIPGIHVIVFGSMPKKLARVEDLPDQMDFTPNSPIAGLGGGTDLAGALMFARKWRPRKTVIISDGLPDSEFEAMEAAAQLTGGIDAIYCGPDGDPAVRFLQSLCKACAGTQVNWDGYRELGTTVRGLLTA